MTDHAPRTLDETELTEAELDEMWDHGEPAGYLHLSIDLAAVDSQNFDTAAEAIRHAMAAQAVGVELHADRDKQTVDIVVLLAASEENEVAQRLTSTIRSALHGLAFATPDWEKELRDVVEFRTDSNPSRTTVEVLA